MSETRRLMRERKKAKLARSLVHVKNTPGAALPLYELLLERDPSTNISHKDTPTFEDHVHFVVTAPYRVWYLILCGEVCVGSAYLTNRNEIGVFIFKAHQGHGHGAWAVGKIITRFRNSLRSRRTEVRHGFLANIAPTNLESQLFFQKQGFKLVQHTYFLDVEYPSTARATV